nr:MBL fold metallo-hydrolase [uncultured Eisenbergiella sp.]
MIRNRILALLGWGIFIGLLLAWVLSVSVSQKAADGEIVVICMQTAEDADAALVYNNREAILIDTGEAQDAEHILAVMKNRGIDKIDYMIVSHPDKDHIGGAGRILEKIPVGRVIAPYYTEDNNELSALKAWLEDNKIPILYPTKTRRLNAGGIGFIVYPPLEKHYNDVNNYSLSVLIQHGSVNMLFTGDAMRKRSEELLYTDWPQIALYKVPHHGRANALSGTLFRVLQPAYAVVTSRTADAAVIEASRQTGTEILYTAGGDLTFISDGGSLKREE